MAAWPTKADLESWLGDDHLSAAAKDQTQGCVDAARSKVLAAIDTDKLPTDVEDCPDAVRTAILITAAGLLVRRDAPNGIVSFGETAMRVNRLDPDVAGLLHEFRVDADP
jgi:hypothetical protein